MGHRSALLPFLAFLVLACPAFSQDLSLSTNVLDYVSGGTFNVNASWGIARHFSVEAAVKYNPFSFGAGENEWFNRQRSLSVGGRWWPWYRYSGWWASAALRGQEYSVCKPGDRSSTEGNRYGAGIGAGHSFMLGKHFNLDVGAGLWAGYGVYSVYACQRCGRTVDEGSGFFILPSDLILSISYIF